MTLAGGNRNSRSRTRPSATLSTLIMYKLRSYHLTKFTERYANILLVASFIIFFFFYSKTIFHMQCSDIFVLYFHENFLRLAPSVHYLSL